jgi:hypothetical protein
MVDTELAVFRRLYPDCCGDLTSLVPVELRENHAKGPLGFRVGGGGAAGGGFLFCGGAPQGKDGKVPDNPFRAEPGEDTCSSLGGNGGGSDLPASFIGSSSLLLVKLTSSSEDAVERRWDVSRGDLFGWGLPMMVSSPSSSSSADCSAGCSGFSSCFASSAVPRFTSSVACSLGSSCPSPWLSPSSFSAFFLSFFLFFFFPFVSPGSDPSSFCSSCDSEGKGGFSVVSGDVPVPTGGLSVRERVEVDLGIETFRCSGASGASSKDSCEGDEHVAHAMKQTRDSPLRSRCCSGSRTWRAGG